MKQCTIEDCPKPLRARGWCEAHYARWKRHGDPLAGATAHLPGRGCTVHDCQRPHEARGYCSTHYAVERTHGDPEGGTRHYADPVEAFARRTVQSGDCVLWTASLDANGYGTMSNLGTTVRAHRYAWEQEHGPIPEGAVIDHICWDRACVNTDHLRLTSQTNNARYRSGAASNSTLGVRGIRFSAGKYRARLAIAGKTKQIGSYATLAEAETALNCARESEYGAYAGRSRHALGRSE